MQNPLTIVALLENQHTITYLDQKQQVFSEKRKIKQVFNHWCLQYGHTYQGTLSAIKQLTNIKQRPPVCISIANQCLFYPLPLNQKQTLWIRYYPLAKNKRVDQHTSIIECSDHISLQVPINIRMIKRQVSIAHRYFGMIAHGTNATPYGKVLMHLHQLTHVLGD